jgi:hypothetical protein
MKNQPAQNLLETLEKYKYPVTDFYVTGSDPELYYYHVPVKDLGNLSLAYMSYNLYQTLKSYSKDWYSWINILLARKYDIQKLQYSNVNPKFKEILINLNFSNKPHPNSTMVNLYDVCIESLVLEIMIYKCLKEINRHKLVLNPSYIPKSFLTYLSKLNSEDSE